jgi:hypothetical protein
VIHAWLAKGFTKRLLSAIRNLGIAGFIEAALAMTLHC